MLTNMNAKSDRLEVEDGTLFAISSYTSKTQPQRIEHWWKLYGFDGLPLLPEFINLDSGAIYKTAGTYCVHSKRQGWTDACLGNGSETVAYKVVLIEIPRPKCREATRWFEGRWQKFKKGWVDA
jgi:hypothetical protein